MKKIKKAKKTCKICHFDKVPTGSSACTLCIGIKGLPNYWNVEESENFLKPKGE